MSIKRAHTVSTVNRNRASIEPRTFGEKVAGPISEYVSSVNPLNMYGGGLLGGAAALSTPTRTLAQQAEYDSTDNIGRAIANLLVPGKGPYNAYKRTGAAIRSPEMKKVKAMRASDKLRRELAARGGEEAGEEADEKSAKTAGWRSEYLGMLNPISGLAAPVAAAAALTTPTRTLDEQAAADEEALSNIFIPGRNVYNIAKRIGAATRSPEMLQLRAQAKQKQLQALMAQMDNKRKKDRPMEKQQSARYFGEKLALTLSTNPATFDAARMGGIGGAALGGFAGLVAPGETEETDEEGYVRRKPRSRLSAMLSGVLKGGLGGVAAGGALGHFRPDMANQAMGMINQYRPNADTFKNLYNRGVIGAHDAAQSVQEYLAKLRPYGQLGGQQGPPLPPG